MAQLVTELELPYLTTIGLERGDAIAAVKEARAQHWLARTDMGYSVTGTRTSPRSCATSASTRRSP